MFKYFKILTLVLLTSILTSKSFAARQVILTWTPPTQNTDGTVISTAEAADLRYRIFYGRASRSYGPGIEVSNPLPTGSGALTTTFALAEESTGNLYFAMSAFLASTGVSSDLTGEVIQFGKVKLLPPGTPEIVGDNIMNSNSEYIVMAFYDQNHNLITPSYEELFDLLSKDHPELLTGELVLVYERNI